MTTLEQVADPNIELLSLVQIVPGEILRTKKRDELAISPKSRIGPQVRRNLLSLILKNQSSRGANGMVVRKARINALTKLDNGPFLPAACPSKKEENIA